MKIYDSNDSYSDYAGSLNYNKQWGYWQGSVSSKDGLAYVYAQTGEPKARYICFHAVKNKRRYIRTIHGKKDITLIGLKRMARGWLKELAQLK